MPSNNEGDEGGSLLPTRQPSATGQQEPKRPDTLLWFCRVLNVSTCAAALLCALALLLAMVVPDSPDHSWLNRATGQLQRIFGVSIALLVILVESEWSCFMQLVPLLDFWIGRGVLQLFEALLTFRETSSVGDSGLHRSLQLYATLASSALLCCAAVYIAGGALCIGCLRRARQRQEQRRARAQAALEALEKRRAELRQQLGRVAND